MFDYSRNNVSGIVNNKNNNWKQGQKPFRKKRDDNIEKMGRYIRIHNAYHFLLEVNSIFLHFDIAVEYRIDLRSNSDHAALSIMYPCLCLSKVFSLYNYKTAFNKFNTYIKVY